MLIYSIIYFENLTDIMNYNITCYIKNKQITELLYENFANNISCYMQICQKQRNDCIIQ